MNNNIINIKEVINSPYAISADKGEVLFVLLQSAIKEKKRVNISFNGLEMVITAFLNSAIGELYKDHKKSDIETFLNYIDTTDDIIATINKVKLNSIKHYQG